MTRRLFLPSGARVQVAPRTADAAPDENAVGPFAAEVASVVGAIHDSRGEPSSLDELELRDLHSLRAVLRRLSLVPDDEIEVVCRNCDAVIRVRPCAGLEVGPYLDDELDDPELDADFDFDHEYPVPELDRERNPPPTLRLARRTVAQARPAHRALLAASGLRFTSAVVEGLGIVALDGETSAAHIARRLSSLDDDAFDAVAAWFETAHYPRRLVARHACDRCGAAEWLPVPPDRELTLAATTAPAPAPEPVPEGFPDVDAFEALVEDRARAVYAEMNVDHVALQIVLGPADCDDGGEPLLGSYEPPAPDALIPRPAEIRIFHRTFARMFGEEGPYDVRAEVEETIRHELTHHLGWLAGDDPLDDDERAAIDEDLGRRVGRAEVRRRALREARGELRSFWRSTWWLWVIAALCTLAIVLADR